MKLKTICAHEHDQWGNKWLSLFRHFELDEDKNFLLLSSLMQLMNCMEIWLDFIQNINIKKKLFIINRNDNLKNENKKISNNEITPWFSKSIT